MKSNQDVELKIRALVEGMAEVQRLTQELTGLDSAASQPIADPTEGLRHGADESALSVANLSRAFAALGAGAAVKSMLDASMAAERNNNALEALTGSAEDAGKEFEYIRATANRLGLEVTSTADAYISLMASTKGTNLEGQQTKAIFEAVAGAMAVLGKSTAETETALRAVGQMAAKGTVSMEELRGQLGEALPGAMQAAADAMGLTVAELDKLVASGNLTADELLPKLATQLKATFGEPPADSATASINRLQNTVNDIYVTLGETSAMETFGSAMQGITKGIKAGGVAAATGFEAFQLLGKAIGAVAALLSGGISFAQFKQELGAALDGARGDVGKMLDKLYAVQTTAQDVAAEGAKAGKAIGDGAKEAAGEVEKSTKKVDDLAAALKRLKVDPEEITTGLDAATREIIRAFDIVRTDPALDGRVIMASFNNAISEASSEAVPALTRSLLGAFEEGQIGADELAKGTQIIAKRLIEAKAQADVMYQSGQIGAEQYKAKLLELASAAGNVGQQLQQGGQQQLGGQMQQLGQEAEGAAGSVQKLGKEQKNTNDSGAQLEQGLGVVIDTTNELGESTSSAGDILKWMRGEVDAAVSSIAALSESAGRAVEALKNSGEGFTEWTNKVAQLNAMDFVGANPMNDLAADAEALSARLDETGQMIEELSRRSMFSPGAWKPWYDGLKSMAQFERELAKAKLRMNEFDTAQYKINQAVDMGNISLAQQASQLRGLESQFRDLGDENLAGLRDAIRDTEDRLKDLGDAARDTLGDLRDELDEMNGDLDSVEKRRADARRADIEAKLAEAQAAGNTQAVRDYQEALRVLDQVSKARIADAAAREKEEAAARASTVEPRDTTPTKTVNVDDGMKAVADKMVAAAEARYSDALAAASADGMLTSEDLKNLVALAKQGVTYAKQYNVKINLPGVNGSLVTDEAGAQALLLQLETLGARS